MFCFNQSNRYFQAAKQANAHTFITEQPEGYETDVGEKGQQLSGYTFISYYFRKYVVFANIQYFEF